MQTKLDDFLDSDRLHVYALHLLFWVGIGVAISRSAGW